ncbi:MAG: response regulator [Leptolyngbyaceae cyanobacterium bins.302]|nr:response regulator [Leptolyngbyaceae cyanobacterium bins.302]
MSLSNLPASQLLQPGLRLLVVDANLDSRELLVMLFAEYGVETLTAASVREALEIIQRTQIDLVISEIALPDENGYSFIRKLKAAQVEIPAIALTVYTGDIDRQQALLAGFCQHLPKPLDLDRLVKTVASVTQRAQAAWERSYTQLN